MRLRLAIIELVLPDRGICSPLNLQIDGEPTCAGQVVPSCLVDGPIGGVKHVDR